MTEQEKLLAAKPGFLESTWQKGKERAECFGLFSDLHEQTPQYVHEHTHTKENLVGKHTLVPLFYLTIFRIHYPSPSVLPVCWSCSFPSNIYSVLCFRGNSFKLPHRERADGGDPHPTAQEMEAGESG